MHFQRHQMYNTFRERMKKLLRMSAFHGNLVESVMEIQDWYNEREDVENEYRSP